jgi:hypothetical protein
MDTCATTTEGERIFDQTWDLLNTMPPDDRLAPLAGCIIAFLNIARGPKAGELVNCDVCEKTATREGVWNRIPVPKPSSRHVCDEHRNLLEGCTYWYKLPLQGYNLSITMR